MGAWNVIPIMQTHRLFKIIPLALAVVALTGCETLKPAAAAEAVIDGTITYRERMLLPPGATITVGLEDVSRMDVPAKLIAETSFAAVGAPPYAFRLAYPAEDIVERRRYGLRVRIEHNDSLLFINHHHIDPFATAPGESLDVVVRRASRPQPSTRNPVTMPNASLTETYWKVTEIDGTPTRVFPNQREPHLVLQADGVARGHSGCNLFRGGYELKDQQVTFGNMASTQKACIDGMAQEQRFLRALGASTHFRIEGDTLRLTDETGEPRLTLAVVYLP
jgi:putative lipoprotein